ncbi:hypothetical protein EMIHUDRAFT_356802, partial [Emiliania huxleyi CCMP1516]
GWASRSRHAGRASGWHAPATPRARRLRGHRSASPRPTAMALGCEVGWRHGAPTCCPSAFGGSRAPREAPSEPRA